MMVGILQMGKCRNRKQYSSLIDNKIMCTMWFFFLKSEFFFWKNCGVLFVFSQIGVGALQL